MEIWDVSREFNTETRIFVSKHGTIQFFKGRSATQSRLFLFFGSTEVVFVVSAEVNLK